MDEIFFVGLRWILRTRCSGLPGNNEELELDTKVLSENILAWETYSQQFHNFRPFFAS